jgi:hypothetical protein
VRLPEYWDGIPPCWSCARTSFWMRASICFSALAEAAMLALSLALFAASLA